MFILYYMYSELMLRFTGKADLFVGANRYSAEDSQEE